MLFVRPARGHAQARSIDLQRGSPDGLIPLDVTPEDIDAAADIYRAVRASGHSVRSAIDCLIAAIAERHGARLVHADGDFVRIAAVVPSLDSSDVR